MEEWINGLIGYVTSPLRDLISAVGERIGWVYSLIVRVLTSVKNAQGRLFNAVANFRNWITWAIGEAYLTLRWLITIKVPQMLANAQAALVRWATGAIQVSANALRSVILTLDRWIKARVSELLNTISDLRKWSLAQINSILDVLRRVRDIVYLLLTSPQRLAAWLVGAMTEELWRYANRNADKIAIWMRAKSVKYTLAAAGQIESIIARLL